MLYGLSRPGSFLVLLASFVLGVTLHGFAQAFVADRVGDRRPRLKGRISFNPRHQIDPFGALAGLVGGVGWSTPTELLGRRQRGASVAVALAGVVANLLLAAVCLLGWRLLTPTPASEALAAFMSTSGASESLSHGTPLLSEDLVGIGLLLVGVSQLYLAGLALIPIPPLPGGQLLFALAPRTQGWQRAEYHLVHQNIGTFVVLVGTILPLGRNELLLPSLLDAVLKPLVRAVLGVL